MINWDAISKEDFKKIEQITKRAVQITRECDGTIDGRTTMMDLTAVHINIGLRLDEMLEAKDFDLMHDVTGITAYIDRRDNGRLCNHFVPRFARATA